MDPFQPFKKTIKESTIHSKNNGYINNTEASPTIGLMDDVRKTKKQTTINSKNNGYLKGDYEGRTSNLLNHLKTLQKTLHYLVTLEQQVVVYSRVIWNKITITMPKQTLQKNHCTREKTNT